MRTPDSITLPARLRSWSFLHWTGVFLSAAIAGMNLYVGYMRADPAFVLISLSFLFGIVLFASRFWQPVLYLLGVLHVGVLGVLWTLEGFQHLELGVLTGVLSAGLAVIAFYLFFEEEATPHPGVG